MVRSITRYLFEAAIVLAILSLVAVVWAAVLRGGTKGEQAATANAFAEASSHVDLLALEWSEKLTLIAWLQSLAREVTRRQEAGDPNAGEFMAELRRAVDFSGPDFTQVSSVDPNGNVTWSSNGLPATPLNVRNTKYFQDIASGRHDRVIGDPSPGLVTGEMSVRFAEAVRGDDGSLKAITVVTVHVASLNLIADQFFPHDGQIISYVRDDGVVLARSDNAGIGTKLGRMDPLLREAITKGSAMMLARSPIDNTLRFYAGRYIAKSGVMVAVGLDYDMEMASARQAIAQSRQWATIITIALLALAITLPLAFARLRGFQASRARLQQLIHREALLRQIAEQGTDIITLFDRNMRVIYNNPAYFTVLGMDPRRSIGREIGDLVLSPDASGFEEAISTISREGGSQRVVCRVRHADGGYRWLEMELVAVEASQNLAENSCRYIAFSRDVSRRKENEEALRETQLQMQILLRHGTGLLYRLQLSLNEARDVWDEHEITVSAFAPALLYGFTHEQFTTPGFFLTRVFPEDVENVKAMFRQCSATGEAALEFRFANAADEYRWIRNQMTLASRSGGQREIVVYATDITAEIEERQRIQKAGRLVTLGEITTNIAHEIHQPLAVIAMAAENALHTLENGGDPGGVIAAKLQRIMLQSHRITDVIEHVRMFVRDEKAQSVDLNLANVIDQALLLASGRLLASAVGVTLDVPHDLPRLHLPRIPLEQVLLNIIVNACDAYDEQASPAGEPRGKRALRISAAVESETIVLSIADKAGGIPEAVLPRLFDPFFTTKPPGIGVGIGLSVSFANIREMGGMIVARNSCGGAVFEISLPLPGVPAILNNTMA